MVRTLIKTIKDIPDAVTVVNNAVNSSNLELNRIEKKGLLNIVQNFVPASSSFSGTTSRIGVVIIPLTTTIVTSANNSKICYDLTIGFEMHHDTSFFIQRIISGVITEIGSHDAASAGARGYGFITPSFDADVNSTLDQKGFKFIDQPNVLAGTTITYQIRFYGNNHAMYLNRVAGASNAINFERCSSCVLLTEYGD
jgi:hypothetical protein